MEYLTFTRAILYIRKEDRDLWIELKAEAKEKGIHFSVHISNILRAYRESSIPTIPN
jgi:hypothetical protein